MTRDREQPRGLPARAERDECDSAETHTAPQLALPLVRAAGEDEVVVDVVLPHLARGDHPAHPHPVDVELAQHRLLLGGVRRDGQAVRRLPVADLDEPRHVDEALVDQGAHERLPALDNRRLPIHGCADDREQPLPLPLPDPAVDVQAAPHVAADVPLRRRPAVEHPPVVAVRGAQPVLDLERPAVRGGAHAAVVRPVGRMDPVLPGQAQVGVGLGAGELQPAPVDEEPLPARPVSPDERGGRVGHRPEAALGLATRPAERHPAVDACPQLAGRERGDEVVVGAGAQTLDGGLRPGPRRHEHHRHQGGARVAPQRGQQVQAAQPGQRDVGEHEVGRVGHGGDQRGRPVRHGLDAVRAAEEPREVGAHVRVVVDHQDAARVRVVRQEDGRRIPGVGLREATTAPR